MILNKWKIIEITQSTLSDKMKYKLRINNIQIFDKMVKYLKFLKYEYIIDQKSQKVFENILIQQK